MTLTTIATNNWKPLVDRFSGHATRTMPGTDVKVLWQDDERSGDYLHFDRMRMALTTLTGQDAVLYYDPDVDIIRDVSDIGTHSEKPLLWVRSPVPIPGIEVCCDTLGLERPAVHANIGCLYLRDEFTNQWARAEEAVMKLRPVGMLVGSVIFNIMLVMHPEIHAEVPYEYDVRWCDVPAFATARAIHFCNDHGKAIRQYFTYTDEGVNLRA